MHLHAFIDGSSLSSFMQPPSQQTQEGHSWMCPGMHADTFADIRACVRTRYVGKGMQMRLQTRLHSRMHPWMHSLQRRVCEHIHALLRIQVYNRFLLLSWWTVRGKRRSTAFHTVPKTSSWPRWQLTLPVHTVKRQATAKTQPVLPGDLHVELTALRSDFSLVNWQFDEFMCIICTPTLTEVKIVHNNQIFTVIQNVLK